MTDTGKPQRKPDAGAGAMAAGRGSRGPAPSSQPAGRSPQAPRAPQGQRKPGAASDDEEVTPDLDDEEE
jgi:hypothetical protein